MNKQQLEEKIKNKESVWFIDFRNEISKITNKEYRENCGHLSNQLDKIFSTKAEAEHYLKNSGVTRIEKLPFVTWEEAMKHSSKDYYCIEFYDKIYRSCCIEINFCFRYIGVYRGDFLYEESRYDLTEENFYKAYDIARKLFLGEENNG